MIFYITFKTNLKNNNNNLFGKISYSLLDEIDPSSYNVNV